MSKRNNNTQFISLVIIIILFATQFVYTIVHTINYYKRVEQGNARWNQVENRVVTVENRLDLIEDRVDKIEKGL